MADHLEPQKYPPEPGSVLSGARIYRIERRLGQGGRGTTFVAKRLVGDPALGQMSTEDFVVKVPSLNLDMSSQSIDERLLLIEKDTNNEINAWYRIKQSDESQGLIADIVDTGNYVSNISDSLKRMPFLVQEFIRGRGLSEWCVAKWGKLKSSKSNVKIFRGIPTADEWFEAARKLCANVKIVHDQRVVHGDIWPDNVMVRNSDDNIFDPVLIDFGQAWLLDHRFQISGTDVRRYPYYAPERWAAEGRTWYAPADIYSLGGLLYYLATGDDPESPYKFSIDLFLSKSSDQKKELAKDLITNTLLKERIFNKIYKNNPTLLADNLGVVDIIHYGLRPHVEERASHSDAILDMMDIFTNCFRPIDSDEATEKHLDKVLMHTAALSKAGRALGVADNPIFHKMVGRSLTRLHSQVQSVATRLYNITGSREDIINELLIGLSALRQGDSCFALTTTLFWAKQNFGAKGRVLTLLKMAALHGINIRWVTLLSEQEQSDENVHTIMKTQAKACDEVRLGIFKRKFGRVVNISNTKIDGQGYYSGFCLLPNDELIQIIRQARTFILLDQKQQQENVQFRDRTLIAPTYSQRGGGITIVRCWSNPERWDVDFKEPFERYLAMSEPASTFAEKHPLNYNV